jgi:hypothetical protein
MTDPRATARLRRGSDAPLVHGLTADTELFGDLARPMTGQNTLNKQLRA